jgi:hypothetical protein
MGLEMAGLSSVLQLDTAFSLRTIEFLFGGFGAADTVVTSKSSFGHFSVTIVTDQGRHLVTFLMRMVPAHCHSRTQLSSTVALRTRSRRRQVIVTMLWADTILGGCLTTACMDLRVTPCVDLLVDVAATGFCTDRKITSVMICNLVGGWIYSETGMLIQRGLGQITFHNSWVQKRMGNNGTVRGSNGDVGRMFAIGTRVLLDGKKTVVPYKTNTSVPVKVLRSVVLSMCRIATYSFPEALSVISDISLPFASGMCADVKSYSATVDMSSTGATTNATVPLNSTTTVCSADLLELDGWTTVARRTKTRKVGRPHSLQEPT